MNIEKIYIIETVRNLHNEIKMFEKERINTDTINKDRLKPLYELYYNSIDKLNKMWSIINNDIYNN